MGMEEGRCELPEIPSEGPTIDQVLEEFLAEQEVRLAARTFLQYQAVVDLLRTYIEAYDGPDDPALVKVVDEAHQRGTEYAWCGLGSPKEIAYTIGHFLGWFMVRKVVAGQDLMRAAGSVTRRLGRWLYEHHYIDETNAEIFQSQAKSLGRALPKATDLRNKLSRWVDGLGGIRSDASYEGDFEIVAITDRGWKLEGVDSALSGEISVPSELRHGPEVGWRISGVVARMSQSFRWVEIWNVYPR